MDEGSDRRAAKKARTRAHIRTVAQEMFAEQGFDVVTIADVARRAGVAVQTVFNHFSTKEELFFDGRADWVSGPADAVRHRPATESPLSALQTYLGEFVQTWITELEQADAAVLVRTLDGSSTLRAYERELVFQSERQLSAALVEAWSTRGGDQGGPVPPDHGTAAALTAAVWINAVRALLAHHRPLLLAGEVPPGTARDLLRLADRLMDGLAETTQLLQDGPAARGAEPLTHRRAG